MQTLSISAQYFRAQAEAKQAERETMLRKMSPEQRERFLAEEAEADAHDKLKSKHVLRTTGMFRAASNPLTAGGRGGRGGRGAAARSRSSTTVS